MRNKQICLLKFYYCLASMGVMSFARGGQPFSQLEIQKFCNFNSYSANGSSMKQTKNVSISLPSHSIGNTKSPSGQKWPAGPPLVILWIILTCLNSNLIIKGKGTQYIPFASSTPSSTPLRLGAFGLVRSIIDLMYNSFIN